MSDILFINLQILEHHSLSLFLRFSSQCPSKLSISNKTINTPRDIKNDPVNIMSRKATSAITAHRFQLIFIFILQRYKKKSDVITTTDFQKQTT